VRNGLADAQCVVAACSPAAKRACGALAASHAMTEVVGCHRTLCPRRFGAYTSSRPTTAVYAVGRGRTNCRSRSVTSKSYARRDARTRRGKHRVGVAKSAVHEVARAACETQAGRVDDCVQQTLFDIAGCGQTPRSPHTYRGGRDSDDCRGYAHAPSRLALVHGCTVVVERQGAVVHPRRDSNSRPYQNTVDLLQQREQRRSNPVLTPHVECRP
jgi:hypothetical protein